MSGSSLGGGKINLDDQMATLDRLATENREFQQKVMEISIKLNGDNKMGQKSGDVGR